MVGAVSGKVIPMQRGYCAEAPAKESWRWGRAGSGGSRLRLSRWGWPLKEVSHLWGGTEVERVTVSGFRYCIAMLWLRGPESSYLVQL